MGSGEGSAGPADQRAGRPRVVRLGHGYDGRRRPAAARHGLPVAVTPASMDALPTQPAETLAENLERIRAITIAMGEMVDQAIHRATQAILERDIAASNEVIRGDETVNAMQADARQLCFAAIARQAPSERELRELLGFQHMAAELERMADHCVNIARVGRDLADLPPLGDFVDIPKLSRQVATQVRDILSALVSHDGDEARAIAARDDLVNRLYHRLVDELIQMMSEDPDIVYQGTKLITVCQNYERIADRVTNLAEDLVFLESGEIEDLG